MVELILGLFMCFVAINYKICTLKFLSFWVGFGGGWITMSAIRKIIKEGKL